MKHFGRLCFFMLVCACVFTTHASALDLYRVAAGNTFAVENMLLTSAIERGTFAAAGIDLQIVPVADMALMTQRLQNGDVNAHVYLTPAWQANHSFAKTAPEKFDELCTTMLIPFSWRFAAAVISTTSNWKDIIGGTVIFSGAENFASHMTVNILAAHGVPIGSYQIQNVRGFTEPRIRAMFSTNGPALTIAFDPLFEYVRRTEGVHVLADLGSEPLVSGGLMVRCSDKDDPKKWALDRRVVGVLAEEIKWILDAQKSEAQLVSWTQQIVEKDGYEKKYGQQYAGRPVKPASEDPAKAIVDRTRNQLRPFLPNKADMEQIAEVLLGRVPEDFHKYYDFSLVPKDFTAVSK